MRSLTKLLPPLAIFGMVTAISAAPDPTPAPQPSPPAAKAPTMSVAEMNAAAANIEARLEEDTQTVIHLQDIAKKQKDVIKLTCVNDRLVQVKAQRNIADEARTKLNVALSKGSDDRNDLYAQFNSVGEAVKDLREQAKACIGTPELYKQESGVVVDRPVIPDDPTITEPTIEVFEPPGYASPYD
jgi:Spy/CpxP family protein refolding chaperone